MMLRFVLRSETNLRSGGVRVAACAAAAAQIVTANSAGTYGTIMEGAEIYLMTDRRLAGTF